MERVSICCDVDRGCLESLDKLAAEIDRDREELINLAITRYVAREQWQLDEVARAIAEIEAGDFFTEEEFQADMKTWRRSN